MNDWTLGTTMPYVRNKSHGRSRLTYESLPAIIWTQPGGIVWVGVAMFITIHLGMFAFTAGMAPPRNFGIPMDCSNPKLSASDVHHLRLGGAISDLQGQILIDPRVDSLLFTTVDRGGTVLIERQTSSNPTASSRRTLAILLPRNGQTFAEFVRALDRVREDGVAIDGVWLSAPVDAKTSETSAQTDRPVR